MPKNNGRERRLHRQGMAEEMAKERAARTPQQQWEQLDSRLGKDFGACRERARLFVAQEG